MSTLATLYKRDSKGKERQWKVWTEGATVIVEHGQIGGKQARQETTAEPKNVGRANATTAEEQALSEAQSKWNKQKDRQGYHEDINQSGDELRPMLALDYRKVPHRVDWERALAQPKLDGLRLSAGYRKQNSLAVEMMTRKGLTYNVPHLYEDCVDLLQVVNDLCGGKCLALDGEAYKHGLPLQTISSYAKKYREGLTETLEYHLFDLIIPGMSFSQRYTLLGQAMQEHWPSTFHLVPVEILRDEEHMVQLHGEYRQQGYEGLMIRHADSEYKIGGRSPDLFKYKEFDEGEFKITGTWTDKNGCVMFDCITKEGAKFEVTPKMTHEQRKYIATEEAAQAQYIDKWYTVQHQGWTEDRKPSFPVGLGLRECDENGDPLI